MSLPGSRKAELMMAAAPLTPLRSCRSYYIMCMMAITFLNLIGIPMEIAFLDGHSGLVWEGFNVFSDTLFLIDVALNFRMGIITDDCEVRAARAPIFGYNLEGYNPRTDKHTPSTSAPAVIYSKHEARLSRFPPSAPGYGQRWHLRKDFTAIFPNQRDAEYILLVFICSYFAALHPSETVHLRKPFWLL